MGASNETSTTILNIVFMGIFTSGRECGAPLGGPFDSIAWGPRMELNAAPKITDLALIASKRCRA
jgi:hypothetical protein